MRDRCGKIRGPHPSKNRGAAMANRFTLYGTQLWAPTTKGAPMLALSGEPVDYHHVDLRAGAHKQPDYLAKKRFGQVPALVDGDLKLCQSGPILLYSADTVRKR